MDVFLALLPDLLLILIGVLLRNVSGLGEAGWKAIDTLNFRVLFPALIFFAASGAIFTLHDLTAIGLGVWLIMALGCGLAWLFRPFGPQRFLDFAGLWQTAWRFNSAIALVATNALSAEIRSMMAVAIGTAVPVANIMAISALSRGNALSLAQTVKQVLSNPFFLASIGGILLSSSGLMPPPQIMEVPQRLAEAAIPLALLSIGASLDGRALARMNLFLGVLNGIKLLALPGITLIVARLAGLPAAQTSTLVIFAALPTASAAHILASVFGADRAAVATMIAQSTLLGCITLPLWLALLG
ncbi:AEC family transporter [Falsirhodobacter algicola]|uniref:AEC family transporter n=1 Tax=Falsirhodobacter algicola TaxID=2692330 RepID=A0A8J8MR88_9RHOB|nr:AEC family transporter [Falsirhodobacter algicola]QUS35282.1 AEC family transporter [Falsirhodobacter algicola]